MAASMKTLKIPISGYLSRYSTNAYSTFMDKSQARKFGTTCVLRIKKIEVETKEKLTVIEGKHITPEKQYKVRTIKAPSGCPLCEFQDKLTYRDVLILQQFLSPDGQILPRHVTGVCFTMQWKLANILYQSYSAGLLPKYKPILPVNEDPATYDKNYKWRKNNVYFDDFSTESPL